MRQTLLILTLIVGIFLPYGHPYTFLVRYSVMTMLLFAFLGIRIHKGIIKKAHFGVLIGIVSCSLGLYFLISFFDSQLALIAFITCIAPTAAFAPVMTDMLRGNVAFVTMGVVINSFLIAIFLPMALPFMLAQDTDISGVTVLLQVMSVLGLPLIIAQLIRNIKPSWSNWMLKYKGISFYLFLGNVYIATSSASYFIQYKSTTPTLEVATIGIVSLIICAISFGGGYLMGKKGNGLEYAMSMGRKNTMFAIWLCLTFVGPVAALGPMFYIIYQNAFNSYQLYVLERK